MKGRMAARKTPASREAATKGVIRLTGFAEKEDGQFVSYCRELGTSSCGDTAEEALQSLGDAIQVHIQALIETGELHSFLRERNIRIEVPPTSGEFQVSVRPQKIFTVYQQQVPVTS
jgi:predicted RNase H-like HicB family nuclease